MLKSIEISGFKSFANKTKLDFTHPISAIVGPNGSGKSNAAEAFRFVLGEQSMKSLRSGSADEIIFNGATSGRSLNRACVIVTLDNSEGVLDVEYPEVQIERVIHRDGRGEYKINGSRVRLKDIARLLSCANIGNSGYHIISQGESDRFLIASPKDRARMLEDALGLKQYHTDIKESISKLSKTETHISDIKAERREITPRLNELERMRERITRRNTLQQKLKDLYIIYLQNEKRYVDEQEQVLKAQLEAPQKKKKEIERTLTKLNAEASEEDVSYTKRLRTLSENIRELEEAYTALRKKEDTYNRDIGRLEGEVDSYKQTVLQKNSREGVVKKNVVSSFLSVVRSSLKQMQKASQEQVVHAVEDLEKKLEKFEADISQESKSTHDVEKKLADARIRLEKTTQALEDNKIAQQNIEEEKTLKQKEYNRIKQQNLPRDSQRSVLEAELKAVDAELRTLARDKETYEEIRTTLRDEMATAAQLIGREVISSLSNTGDSENESASRHEQHERLREIERLKIQLEQLGNDSFASNEEEYTELSQRKDLLERELSDMERARDNISSLISELREKLAAEFSEGIENINKKFKEFFTEMFGGGDAKLSPVVLGEQEDGTPDIGIDVFASPSKKKVKGLSMLSGGERALTSAALLFALAHLNPPAFIVLDETDAALDEANSRRYGDLIERLSEHSQLVLITHNRETMSRAGLLYGVTMGADGISRLLSIAFDDAVKVAKS